MILTSVPSMGMYFSQGLVFRPPLSWKRPSQRNWSPPAGVLTQFQPQLMTHPGDPKQMVQS